MVTVNQGLASTPVAAPDILQRRREASQLQQLNEVQPGEPQPGDWLYGVIVGDSNTDDFIYGPNGTLGSEVSPTENTNADFWVKEPEDASQRLDGPVAKPWEQTYATRGDFIDGLHNYFRSVIKTPQTAEQAKAAWFAAHGKQAPGTTGDADLDVSNDPRMQAMKDAEVKGQVPERAHDLVLYTGALNSLIARTNSTEYQTDEHYKANIDKFIEKFKGLITGAYNYLNKNADVQGALIQANEDGTYSNPAFTLSYQGQVLFSHPDE